MRQKRESSADACMELLVQRTRGLALKSETRWLEPPKIVACFMFASPGPFGRDSQRGRDLLKMSRSGGGAAWANTIVSAHAAGTTDASSETPRAGGGGQFGPEGAHGLAVYFVLW